MTLARAHLSAGDVTMVMPVNPYTAKWGYAENSASFDTLGGRVVQLLSAQVTDLTVESVAGSRRDLQRVAELGRQIMDYHIRTLRPAVLMVPSREWKFHVYLQAMPMLGWDVAATTYPYQMVFGVQEDLTGIKSHQIEAAAFTRLVEGVGYTKAFHGGDPEAFNKTVKSVLSASALGQTTSANTPSETNGTDGRWQGESLWTPKVANAPWTGASLQDQIKNCWQAVYDSKTATDALCICQHESGFNPRANNSYRDKYGNLHYVYGLFQISDVHSASPWFPKSGVHGTEGGLLYDAEYNCRSAMQIYASSGWVPWSTRGSCGV